MRDKATQGLFGVVMLCVALACGCNGTSLTEPAAAAGGSSAHCADLTTPIEQVECYADVATQAGHPKSCLDATDPAVSHPCLAILAGRLRDVTLCDDIPASSAESRALRNRCLGDVADVLDQGTLCARIDVPALRDSCYTRVES